MSDSAAIANVTTFYTPNTSTGSWATGAVAYITVNGVQPNGNVPAPGGNPQSPNAVPIRYRGIAIKALTGSGTQFCVVDVLDQNGNLLDTISLKAPGTVQDYATTEQVNLRAGQFIKLVLTANASAMTVAAGVRYN
jgi:hypothetical protein